MEVAFVRSKSERAASPYGGGPSARVATDDGGKSSMVRSSSLKKVSSTVALESLKFENAERRAHKLALSKIKARRPGTGTIDSTSPSTMQMGHLQTRLKAKHQCETRLLGIKRKNGILLQRMTAIITKLPTSPRCLENNKSLNDVGRRRFQQKVEMENALHSERLASTRATYDTKSWEKDYQHQAESMRRHAKPPIFFTPASVMAAEAIRAKTRQAEAARDLVQSVIFEVVDEAAKRGEALLVRKQRAAAILVFQAKKQAKANARAAAAAAARLRLQQPEEDEDERCSSASSSRARSSVGHSPSSKFSNKKSLLIRKDTLKSRQRSRRYLAEDDEQEEEQQEEEPASRFPLVMPSEAVGPTLEDLAKDSKIDIQLANRSLELVGHLLDDDCSPMGHLANVTIQAKTADCGTAVEIWATISRAALREVTQPAVLVKLLKQQQPLQSEAPLELRLRSKLPTLALVDPDHARGFVDGLLRGLKILLPKEVEEPPAKAILQRELSRRRTTQMIMAANNKSYRPAAAAAVVLPKTPPTADDLDDPEKEQQQRRKSVPTVVVDDGKTMKLILSPARNALLK